MSRRILLIVGLILVLVGVMTMPASSQEPRTRIESDTVQQSGQWTRQVAADRTYMRSGVSQDDTLTLHFSGSYVEIIYLMAPDLGTLAVEIDGAVLRTLVTTADQEVEARSVIDYLDEGEHILRVYPASGRVAIDAFVVSGGVRDGVNWYVAPPPTGDDGNDCQTVGTPCATIDAAVGKAGDNDIINIAAGTYIEFVTVNKDLTFVGAGTDQTMWDGGYSFTPLTVQADTTVTVQDLAIISGFTNISDGGGVANHGTTTLDNVLVDDNSAPGMGGGGIYTDGPSLTIIDSTVSNNSAYQGAGLAAGGGTVTITNTTFDTNQAVDYGGGLYNDGADVTIQTGSLFTANYAEAYGGGAYNNGTSLTIDASTFDGNEADTRGGGVYNAQGTLNIQNNAIIQNNTSGQGGAILNQATLNMSDSVVSGNSGSQGGGLFEGSPETATITNTEFDNNEAEAGGAIYNGGTVTLDDCTITNNSADEGGGIYNDATLNEDNSAYEDNTATSNGGGIFNSANGNVLITTGTTFEQNSASQGGGVYNEGQFSMNGAFMSQNSASTSGGGVENHGGMWLANSVLNSNKALTGFGGALANFGSITFNSNTAGLNQAQFGGAIFNSGDGTPGLLTINGGIIDANTATNNGAAIYNFLGTVTIGANNSIQNNTAAAGGGVDSDGGSITVTDSTIQKNNATDGGGIRASNGGTVSLIGSSLVENTATNNGGGIFNTTGGTVTLEDTDMMQNEATSGDGGGLYNGGTSATITESVVSGNMAGANGGGIYSVNELNVSYSNIRTNGAVDGAGVAVNGGQAAFSYSTIATNIASDDGGAFYLTAGTTTVFKSLVNTNQAQNRGGAFYNFGGDLNIANSTVTGNNSANRGGAVTMDGGELNLSNATIVYNTAPNVAGVEYGSFTTNIKSTILAGNDTSDCSGVGPMNSLGYNVVGSGGSANGCTTSGPDDYVLPGDLSTVLEVVLGRYGGETQSHPLVIASPALERVAAGQCTYVGASNPLYTDGATVTEDQRDEARPGGALCDSGAVEGFAIVTAASTLTLVNTGENLIAQLSTLQSWPAWEEYNIYRAGTGIKGQWVIGDWDGNGTETLGVYIDGAFFYSNQQGETPPDDWFGIWLGPTSGYPVAGNWNGGDHDCVGLIVDNIGFWFTCQMTVNPPVMGGQWLGGQLWQFTGDYQFAAGDYDGDGVDTIAIRRDKYVSWTNVHPDTVFAMFTQAQYVGNLGNPGNPDRYGQMISGDWDNNGLDSFGLFFNDGYGSFYYRNDLEWNTGVAYLQHVGQPLGPDQWAMAWRDNPETTP